jgi:hypothetical protein
MDVARNPTAPLHLRQQASFTSGARLANYSIHQALSLGQLRQLTRRSKLMELFCFRPDHWSAAFLEQAGPRIRYCLTERPEPHAAMSAATVSNRNYL